MKINVIGGGLAGSEAALYIARDRIEVNLFEMRPIKMTEAHRSDLFAEIVCSNSFGSVNPENGRGLLKQEAIMLGSSLLQTAEDCKVPAGKALAVDRKCFANKVTKLINSNPYIKIIRGEVKELPEGVNIIATGPLTSKSFLDYLKVNLDISDLYFYDALSPVVAFESLDMNKLFFGGRYEQSPDYLNAPMTKEEYDKFYNSLIGAEKHLPHSFDKKFFEACLPVEEIAIRGKDSLRFGPLRPKGFEKKYYAVVQLRRENLEGTLFELVGFQTALKYGEQKRVFSLIPGLQDAEFIRYGSIHKNAYIKSSAFINEFLQLKSDPRIFFAGQISGVEGYVEAISTGIIAGINALNFIKGRQLTTVPEDTMLGSLIQFITNNPLDTPQPMRANFGIIPERFFKIHKTIRKKSFIEESINAINRFKKEI